MTLLPRHRLELLDHCVSDLAFRCSYFQKRLEQGRLTVLKNLELGLLVQELELVC